MMHRILVVAIAVVAAAGACARAARAQTGAATSPAAPPAPFALSPPAGEGPVEVVAHFTLNDINDISDEAETFEFSGVMTLRWLDPRQAFDPAEAGVDEKVFSGAYQFDEVAPGWWPQVVLVNEAGMYQKSGVVLRVLPDGTCTQIETINAVAEVTLNLRRFPFDRQRLEAVFEVLGFDRDEVALRAGGERIDIASVGLPQWTVLGADASVRERAAPHAGRAGVASAFVVGIDVRRKSFYVQRLITLPLSIIVLLSFAVFWMDRSSLGDRISVSFIGILTAVAYMVVMSGSMPRISYATLMHGFVNLSFLTMCATVVINLVVGSLDKRKRFEAGDRVDRTCRRVFPLVYFGLILVMVVAAFELF